MPLISNPILYPITDIIDGATVTGSLPTGQTVQFSISGIVNYIALGLDFVNFNNATKVGQHVVGNDPDNPETAAPNINEGNKFFGTIKVYPPQTNDDIGFIVRLR